MSNTTIYFPPLTGVFLVLFPFLYDIHYVPTAWITLLTLYPETGGLMTCSVIIVMFAGEGTAPDRVNVFG